MYRFPVNNVDACPLNKTAWESASIDLNCSRGASRLNRYHCIPNQQKSALLEFCYDLFSGRYQKNKCIYLADSGYLNSESCSRFSHGCPISSYLGDEIYNHPACLQISTKNKCYVADNLCVNRETSNWETSIVHSSTVTTTPKTDFTQEDNTGLHVAVSSIVPVLIIAAIVVIFLCKQCRRQSERMSREHLTPLIAVREEETFNRMAEDVRVHVQESLNRMAEGNILNVDQDQRMILYLFLIVDGCCIGQKDLYDFEKSWLQKLNRIRKLFQMPETNEVYVLDVFRLVDEGTDIDDYLTWDVEDITVKSNEARDEIFWSFYYHEIVSSNTAISEHEKTKIRFLLENSPCDVLKNYLRVAGYANEGEKIVCLDGEYTDQMIEKFNIDVIALGNKGDQAFMQRVSEILKIPLEALVLDDRDFKSYVQQMTKGKERLYCGRCIMLGCGGSGKTTLLARLKNESMTAEEIKNLNIESTVGADFAYDIFIVDEEKGTLIKSCQEAKSYFSRPSKQDTCLSNEIEISTENCKSEIVEEIDPFLTKPLYTNSSKETKVSINPVEPEMSEIDGCQLNIEYLVIGTENVARTDKDNNFMLDIDSKEDTNSTESPHALKESNEADCHLFQTPASNEIKKAQALQSIKQDPRNNALNMQKPVRDQKQNSFSNGSKSLNTVKTKEEIIIYDRLPSNQQTIKLPSISDKESKIQSGYLDDDGRNDIYIASQQESSDYTNSQQKDNKGNQSENRDGIFLSDQPTMDRTKKFKNGDSTDQTPPEYTKDDVKTNEFFKQLAMVVPEENFKFISVLDCAGQCTYYPGHQIHMNSASVYILCVNMAKELDAQVDGVESDQRGTTFEGNTYIDYINFFMFSVYAYSTLGTNKPEQRLDSEKERDVNKKAKLPVPLIIIGTHADEAKIDFSEFRNQMCSKLAVDFDKNNVFKLGFPKNKSDYREVSEIKKCITRVVTEGPTWGQEVPRLYMIFESLIRNARKSSIRIMKFEEFEKQNEVLDEKMTTADLLAMLNFFHNIGLILYFKDSVATIRHIIIVDIQWFIDAFKNIIMDKKHFCRKDQNIYHRWLTVYETGQLEDDLLVNIWEVQRERNFIEYKEDLLIFMQKLGMLVAVHETGEDIWYYVPCMNRRTFSQSNDLEGFIPQSTLFCFQFKILPNFIFYHLVVLVASLPGWKFNRRHLYSTAAVLNFSDLCYAVMGMCNNKIQVQLFSVAGESVSRVVKVEISHILVDTMRKIIQMHHINLPYAIGYRCKGTTFCDDKHDNFMDIENLMKTTSIKPLPICDKCQNIHRYNPVDIMWEICPKSYDLIKEKDFSSVAELVYEDIISLRLYRAFTRKESECQAFQNAFISYLGKKTEKSYETNLQFVFLATRYATSDIVKNLASNEISESLTKDDVYKKLLVDAKYDRVSETTYNIRGISWVIAYGRNSLLDFLNENVIFNTEDKEESARILILACLCGDPGVLRTALTIWKNGINSSVLGSENHLHNKHRLYTPLTAACHFNTDAIPALLSAGADMLKKDDAGNTAVDVLIKRKDWSSFKNCICTKQNLEKNADSTFLSKAIYNCYPCDVFECIISKCKESVNFRDNKGETPLHYSAKSKQQEYTNILICHGSAIDVLDDEGISPLIVASALGHECIVGILLKHGANVNLCDQSGRSPLYTASAEGHKDVVSFLIDHGADVNLYAKSGRSPIFAASGGSHIDIVSELIHHGADINIYDNLRRSPLFAASEGGHQDVVSILIHHGANVNLSTQSGRSPLFSASERGYKDAVSLLIEYGADVNRYDKSGQSPLFVASREGHKDVISLLINHGAEVNLFDQYGRSPLFAASEKGNEDVVTLLISHGAEVNLCDASQRSSLFVASNGGHTSVVGQLINHGADVNLCESSGLSPLYAARLGGHKDVVSLLTDHSANINPN